MRALIYALGGGYGHVTRALTLAQKHPFAEIGILISPHLKEIASTFNSNINAPLTLFTPPEQANGKPKELARWVSDRVRVFQPDVFWVDAFPAGIFGELPMAQLPQDLPLWHSARILKLDNYQKRCNTWLRYEKVWMMETLADNHRKQLSEYAEQLIPATIEYAPLPRVASNAEHLLVIHSGSVDETLQLMANAQNHFLKTNLESKRIIVCTSEKNRLHLKSIKNKNVIQIEYVCEYPATELIATSEHIFSGAGFNSVNQYRQWQIPTSFTAFDRVLDDQAMRLALNPLFTNTPH